MAERRGPTAAQTPPAKPAGDAGSPGIAPWRPSAATPGGPPARPVPGWPMEVLAGTTAAVVSMAIVLTIGLLGGSTLGDAAAARGLTAATLTVVLGGTVFALFGGTAMPFAGPSSATALIFAGLLGAVGADAAVDLRTASGLAVVLAGGGIVVLLMGLGQILLAQMGLGRLAQFVPQPVLAGFMNGVAVLIIFAQLPDLLGMTRTTWSAGWPEILPAVQPAALALGLFTAACTTLLGWRWPKLPAQLIGLLLGLGLCVAVSLLWPAVPVGQRVGALPSAMPALVLPFGPDAAQALEVLWRHRLNLVSAAAALALVGSLESLLAQLALDQLTETPHDSRRLLTALGLANVAVAPLGGLPVVVMRVRATVTWRAGGRSWRAALASAWAFGLLYVGLAPALALLPKAVLAGLMLTVAVTLADRWTRQLLDQWRRGERSADLSQSLAIVALVAGLTIASGAVLGVAAGIAVVLVVFVRSLNRSLLRSRHRAVEEPSRRIYPPVQEALLREARARITIFELEGALFFGTAQRLQREAGSLPPGTRMLVLGLRGVSTLDATGALLLERLSRSLAEQGVAVVLAGLSPAHPHGRSLHAFGVFRGEPRDDWFPDVDRAVEAGEQLLLREAGLGLDTTEVPPAQCALLQGLAAADREQVQRHLRRVALAPGDVLFREGDPADSLYLLERGSVTVRAGQGRQEEAQRFISLSPGLMLGETAMLDGQGRSATARADGEAVLWQLTAADLAALAAAHPALAATLYRNMAALLSARLRSATAPRPARQAATSAGTPSATLPRA